MNRVACVIPFYNGGETVARAIDSVLYDNECAEVIVVVDASPEPLRPYLTPQQLQYVDDGKLRIVELATNHGQACARNIGASVSVAPLISFLDQDDVYLTGYLQPIVAALEARPKVAAIEVAAEIVQDGRVVLDSQDPRYGACIHSAPWNVIVRRSAFWACGAFPTGPEFRTVLAGEDIAFKTALKRWFSVLSSPLKFIRHNVREGSATDRYLRRTSVVDGKIVFKEIYGVEHNGSAQAASLEHLRRAMDSLQALRKLDFLDWDPV